MENRKPVSKPSKVFAAEILLWISWSVVAYSLFRAYFIFRASAKIAENNIAVDPNLSMPTMLWSVSIMLGVLGFLIYNIGKRRNWARIIYVLLLAALMAIDIVLTVQSPPTSPLMAVKSSSQSLHWSLWLVAAVLLLQKDVSAWFIGTNNLPQSVAGGRQSAPKEEP